MMNRLWTTLLLTLNSLHFKDLSLTRNQNAIDYARSLAPNNGYPFERYMSGHTSASTLALTLLTPLFVMSGVALFFFIAFCFSCCSFAKSFRRFFARISRGCCCRDRPRRDLVDITSCRLGLFVFVFAFVLLGGVAMFVYLVVAASDEFTKGAVATKCALMRGTFEMIFGLYWSREEKYWSMWVGTQSTYNRAAQAEYESMRNWNTFITNIIKANNKLIHFVGVEANSFIGNIKTAGSLESAQHTFRSVDYILNNEQTLHTNVLANSGSVITDRVIDRLSMTATGNEWGDTNNSILDLATDIAAGSLEVARGAKRTASEINKSLLLLVDNLYVDTFGTYTSFAIMAVAALSAVSLIHLMVVLLVLFKAYMRRDDIPRGVEEATGCTWICYAMYAALVIIVGGYLISIVALFSKSCAFTQIRLLQDNAYKDFPRLHALLPTNQNVATECYSASSGGNWTQALGINDLAPKIFAQTDTMENTINDFMQSHSAAIITDIHELYSSSTRYGWMYLIDTHKTVKGGHSGRLTTYSEILNSGVQWADIDNAIPSIPDIDKIVPNHKLSPSANGRLYGLAWIENKINEVANIYAISTGLTDWCLQSNPNGCAGVNRIVIDKNLDVTVDGRIATVFAHILDKDYDEAIRWLNAVFWAVKKQQISQSTTFPCKDVKQPSATTECGIAEFSPAVPVDVTNDGAADAAAKLSNFVNQMRLLDEAGDKFGASVDASRIEWTNNVIPYCKSQGTPLVILEDQHCRLGLHDYISVIVGEFCTFGNPYLGYATVFLCSLVAVAIVGWIFSYRLWHYLHDRNTMRRATMKMQKMHAEVLARREVEMDAMVFANDDIDELMQEMAEAGGDNSDSQDHDFDTIIMGS
eukprot:GHVS01042343.1.p1 GENE.GHVS01042343.1~~GHVS01042343.1.p1  ORF type:complete len:869 (+),score=96.76 GHVS01042343.1:376-2982(+)